MGALSQREKERKDSLAFLGRIADAAGKPMAPPKPSAGTTPATPPPRPQPPRPAPPAARPPPPAPTNPYAQNEAERLRRRQMEERKAKLEEEKLLRDRRQRELARSNNLEWRGGGFTDIPASIRRTGFDRKEPDLNTKISDILGDARVKEGRAIHREKSRKQSGK